jgi:hypothetical protein
MTWRGAHDYCCSLGMTLLTIQSPREQSCLNQLLSKGGKKLKIWTHNYIKKSAPFTIGSKYWTAGRDLRCPGRFNWCTIDFKDFLKPSLVWAHGEPRLRRNACVYLMQQEEQDPTLGTIQCLELMDFICEVFTLTFKKISWIFVFF